MLDKTNPLWLPPGSIRSILALAVVLSWIAGLVEGMEVVNLVLAFYFMDRVANGSS